MVAAPGLPVWPALQRSPVGLSATWPHGRGGPALLVKGRRGDALSERTAHGFAVYAVPVMAGPLEALVMLAAFFDRPEAPLVYASPVYRDDGGSQRLLDVLATREVEVHLFDPDWMCLHSVGAEIWVPQATRARLARGSAADAAAGRGHDLAAGALAWFQCRSERDDAEAAIVHFVD